MRKLSCWQGLPPPQYIYANMRFKCVALEPPDFELGSWVGAGKVLVDYENEEFILTARPRKAEGGVRGYAANVYRSKDGERFHLVLSMSKEEIGEESKLRIRSVEGTQLLKDPLTGKWYLFISVDTGPEFVWGGFFWETLLMAADDLNGPWKSEGLVIRHDQSYDSCQARDPSIDIVDGRWICLYRAHDHERNMRTALATSSDGMNWKKHGVLLVDGMEVRPFGMSGTTFSGTFGPVFMGISLRSEKDVPRMETPSWHEYMAYMKRYFVAYRIDFGQMNLDTVFSAEWKARSRYEHEEFPLLGYSSLAYDFFKNRMLFYVQAIGPESKKPGLNETVERVLVYECLL